MDFFCSTNWNSARHPNAGEALADEILALGFAGVELGYRLSEAQAEGIRRRVAAGALRVSSVHAYCPAPIGAPRGHPELYAIASRDDDDRAMAVLLLRRNLEFAAEVGAGAVVVHAGRIAVTPASDALIAAAAEDGVSGKRYQKLLASNRRRRARRAAGHLAELDRSLDALLPRAAALKVALCLENLPSWEALPSEEEMLALLRRYAGAPLAYWHDMGHGQVRANLGWIEDHRAWAQKLLPGTRGLHIHDVTPPHHDHLPPGEGALSFADFAFYADADVARVLEPAPGEIADALRAGLDHLRQAWRNHA
jgi:sugar phosphate isomerase/epimerase